MAAAVAHESNNDVQQKLLHFFFFFAGHCTYVADERKLRCLIDVFLYYYKESMSATEGFLFYLRIKGSIFTQAR